MTRGHSEGTAKAPHKHRARNRRDPKPSRTAEPLRLGVAEHSRHPSVQVPYPSASLQLIDARRDLYADARSTPSAVGDAPLLFRFFRVVAPNHDREVSKRARTGRRRMAVAGLDQGNVTRRFRRQVTRRFRGQILPVVRDGERRVLGADPIRRQIEGTSEPSQYCRPD